MWTLHYYAADLYKDSHGRFQMREAEWKKKTFRWLLTAELARWYIMRRLPCYMVRIYMGYQNRPFITKVPKKGTGYVD